MFYLLLSSILRKFYQELGIYIFYRFINFRDTRMKCYWFICTYCILLNLVVHTCTSYRWKKVFFFRLFKVLWESARSSFTSSSEFLLVGYPYAIAFHRDAYSILPVTVKWYPRFLWHPVFPPNLIHTLLILSQLLAVESSVTDFRYTQFNVSDTS